MSAPGQPTGWIASGALLAEQEAAGRIYLTYAAYLARCVEEDVDEPLTRFQFQRSMLVRGLVLAPEDDLDDPGDLFTMTCYPTQKQPGRKKWA